MFLIEKHLTFQTISGSFEQIHYHCFSLKSFPVYMSNLSRNQITNYIKDNLDSTDMGVKNSCKNRFNLLPSEVIVTSYTDDVL